MHNTVAFEYHSIAISDHAPTSIDISFSNSRPAHKFWKFNSQLLSETKLKDFLTKEIHFFFGANDTPDISIDILWDSFKAYLRGQVISYVPILKKRKGPS